MNKKIILILGLILTLFTLTACQENENILAKTYSENDIYYQIFVRSFADSDGDGVGDFNGITDKLDYLTELGVTALWLMPIHPSPTYHGYDVTDYYAVNPDYGTMTDFENLVSAADQAGIKIMLDMVFNHSSNEHPWFQAALEGDETYMAYYNFIDSTINTSNLLGSWNQSIWHKTDVGQYAGYFSYTMPDLNVTNPDVVAEIKDISTFWIDKGVKGFRLDAAHHFFGQNEYLNNPSTYLDNIVFLRDYQNYIDAYAEDIYIIGEVYEEQLYQVVGDYFGAIDAPIGFPVASLIRSSSQNFSNRRYATLLEEYFDYYRSINRDFVAAPFIVNHDMNRFASMVLGDQETMKLAAEMLLVLPGSPIIYYGEEIGMFGYKASGPDIWDETRRTPFLWEDDYLTDWIVSSHQDLINVNNANANVTSLETQMTDAGSLWQTYQRMIQLRKDNIALRYGNALTRYETSTSSLQGFYRTFEHESFSQTVLILHNFDDDPIEMIAFDGQLLYVSGLDDLTDVTMIPARSTVVIEINEA